MSSDITFEDLLKQSKWQSYEEYVNQSQAIIEKDVKTNAQDVDRFVAEIKKSEEFKKFDIHNLNEDDLKRAQKLLANGNVVGVDGTKSSYQLFTGVRCQIGIIAVNYAGEKIQKSFFISEASYHEKVNDIIDELKAKISNSDEITDLALRGLMFYRERETGLDDKFLGKYKLFHGPLIPFELMTNLGRLKALKTNIKMLEKLIDEKRCISIISSSTNREFYFFGLALDEGQYMSMSNYKLGHHLKTRLLANPGKWEANDFELAEKFLKDYADRIKIGVIRVGKRPYVFHAHEDIFDLAAHIIAADSMFQKEKGFPLLIDYADTLASEYFSSGQFQSRIEWELAKTGKYLSEISERKMRNRG